ncbi:MAG: tetratricopeptide repeat protein [Alphaproteobacteria bacterium]|nr:tetratricopeptide repeat protein [Alphaproteobacteria bacterium]
MSLADRLKHRPARLAIAAALLLSACAPTAHTDAVVGGGADTMLRVGDAARDAGDLAAAIPVYRRAHALDPLNVEPLLRLARVLHGVGAYREAGNAWDRALRLEPRNFDARVGYGETLVALGQPALAVEQFAMAAEAGESARLANGLGVANDMLGDPVAAQAAYRAGLAEERSLKLLNNLGLSLALSGDTAEAIAVLEEANEIPGASARHRANLAIAYALSGDTARANEIVREDSDDLSAERAVAFYRTVAAIPDHAARVAAVGAYASARPNGAISVQNARAGR